MMLSRNVVVFTLYLGLLPVVLAVPVINATRTYYLAGN